MLTFVNDDDVSYSFSLYTNASARTRLFAAKPFRGPGTAVYRFTAPLTPGTYYFRCDLHPVTVNGNFIVTPA